MEGVRRQYGCRGSPSLLGSPPPPVLTVPRPAHTFDSSHSMANETHDEPH
jgi:hypothetical protein